LATFRLFGGSCSGALVPRRQHASEPSAYLAPAENTTDVVTVPSQYLSRITGRPILHCELRGCPGPHENLGRGEVITLSVASIDTLATGA